MFGNLIESGSHRRDYKRKGKFFLGTLVFYSALMIAAGIGSIYAYNVSLDDQNQLELTAMLRFPTAPATVEPEHRVEPKATGSSSPKAQAVTVKEVSVMTPYDEHRQLASKETPTLAPNIPFKIGTENIIPVEIGIPGNNNKNPGVSGHGDSPVIVPTDEAPARRPVELTPTPKVEKPPQMIKLPSSVISGKAISKPAPTYPQIAKAAHVSGTVAVQIVIDERGRVISAQATSGHPLLLPAAVQAALRAQFSPTLLSNQPVKVSGVITYNFVLN